MCVASSQFNPRNTTATCHKCGERHFSMWMFSGVLLRLKCVLYVRLSKSEWLDDSRSHHLHSYLLTACMNYDATSHRQYNGDKHWRWQRRWWLQQQHKTAHKHNAKPLTTTMMYLGYNDWWQHGFITLTMVHIARGIFLLLAMLCCGCARENEKKNSVDSELIRSCE